MDSEEKKEKKIRWVERVDNKLATIIKTQEDCRLDFKDQVKKREKQNQDNEERLDGFERKLGRLTGAVVGWYVFILFIGGLIGWLFRIVASMPKHAYVKLSSLFFS